MSSRGDVLALLGGRPVRRYPCFSGLINVTAPGLASIGLTLAEVHTDAEKMAAAAATSYRLFGFGSAVVPLDICVEAGVLGADVDYGADAEFRFPQVTEPLAASATEVTLDVPADLSHRERISTVLEAIGILKRDVGAEVAVGVWVPGPFTLATLIIDLPALLTETRTQPQAVGSLLDQLTDVLAQVGQAYGDAGADLLTVHEMGGSPGFIGPGAFEALVLPRLQRMLAALPGPRVLSVCGRTDDAMDLLEAAGADALSVDQLNDLERSRSRLGPGLRLLGNIDPVGTLALGDEAAVRSAVAEAIAAGADAVWPGCDLLPDLPAANLRAMIDEAARYRRPA